MTPSLPLKKMALQIHVQIKGTGRGVLAMLVLSTIQGLVAIARYRYNAWGQLVFPDGLTVRKEDAAGQNDTSGLAPALIDDEDASSSIVDLFIPFIMTRVKKHITTLDKKITPTIHWSRPESSLLALAFHLFFGR